MLPHNHILYLQMSGTCDIEELRTVALDSADTLIDSGCSVPIARLTPNDVPKVIETVALHSVLLIVKAELDQMMDGLQVSGVLHKIQVHPDFFRPLFLHMSTQSHCRYATIHAMLVSFQYLRESEYFFSKGAEYVHVFRDLLEEIEGVYILCDES